jgi:sulfonate transport system substrate-binding protein
MRLFTAAACVGAVGVTWAAPAFGASKKATGANLAGVTLNVGDEEGIFEGPRQASGLTKGTSYTVNYSTLVGGPAVVAALAGGSIDIGEMSDPPVIFAQAQDEQVKVVAAQEPEDPTKQSNFAIVVKAGSPITSVKDLKGKSVSLLNGTILQYIAIRALQKAGLSYSTIDPVNVNPPSGATAALENGSVDAVVTGLAVADGLVTSGQGKIIATGAGLSRSLNYVVASDAALATAKEAAAISDYVQRLAKAQEWVLVHPSAYAPIYGKYNGITTTVATKVLKQLPIIYTPISNTIKKAQQSEANIFFTLKLIPSKLNTNLEFDTSLNSKVAEADEASASKAGGKA